MYVEYDKSDVNINGERISIRKIHYGSCRLKPAVSEAGSSSVCKEYVIDLLHFSVRRLLLSCLVSVCVAISLSHLIQSTTLMLCVVTLLLLTLIIKLHVRAVRESLLIITSLGIQVTTTYASGRRVAHFIHSSHIGDIIINEGVSMHRVVFYLAIIFIHPSPGSAALTPPLQLQHIKPIFVNSWPRLSVLRPIYVDLHEAALISGCARQVLVWSWWCYITWYAAIITQRHMGLGLRAALQRNIYHIIRPLLTLTGMIKKLCQRNVGRILNKMDKMADILRDSNGCVNVFQRKG